MKSRQDALEITSLLYVSKSKLNAPDMVDQIGELVETSRQRNAALYVTGALIFTERHFAQLLEGPEASIDELMTSINRDARHERVQVVDVTIDNGRKFPGWSLAYWGSATFVDSLITPFFGPPTGAIDTSIAVDRLQQAVFQFAVQSNGGDPIGRGPGLNI